MRSAGSLPCLGTFSLASPLHQPPLCGIPDAGTVRSLYDYTLLVDSLPDYGLLGYNSVLHKILVNTKTETVNYVQERVFLHTSLYGFESKLFKRQGWQGLLGSVPPLSQQDEKALITPLFEGLRTLFKMNLDTLPNLSRDTAIFNTGNTLLEDDMEALFIGGSNANHLANSAAMLSIIAETVATTGWVLSTETVTAILPQVIELCSSLPDEAPVMKCLDGQLSAMTKQKDGLFHVPGEIVGVHKVTLAAAVTSLKQILVACGNRMVFIITPCLGTTACPAAARGTTAPTSRSQISTLS
jgi:hypothetical protein